MSGKAITICVFLILFLSSFVSGELVHRYSFTDGDTTAVDSVGSVDGTLEGGASINDNAVQLDGTDDYVNLPGNLITGYTSVTLEGWFTHSSNGGWPRLFDFGDTNSSGTGRWYIFMTPASGFGDARLAVSDTDPGFGNEEIADTSPIPYDVSVYVACVYDGDSNSMSLYVDGALADSISVTVPLSSVQNVHSYLGRSLYSDPYLLGTIDEFRIYDRALSEPEIQGSYLTGPDSVVIKYATNPYPPQHKDNVDIAPTLSWDGPAGENNTYDVWRSMTPTDTDLVQVASGISATSYPLTGLMNEATYYWRIDSHIGTDPNTYEGPIWDFTTESGTPASAPEITSQPVDTGAVVDTETTFTVVAINPNTGDTSDLSYQWYKGQPGDTSMPVGINDAALTFSSVQAGDKGGYYCRVTITTDPEVLTDSVSAHLHVITESLVHRYSFTDGDTTAVDSVGSADGTLEGGAVISGNAVQLDGTDDYVNLPGNLIDGYTSVTFEGWFTHSSNGSWPRLFDFGDTNSSGAGRWYLFMAPMTGFGDTRLVISGADPGWSNEEITDTSAIPYDVSVCVACVYDVDSSTMRLYVNGTLADSVPVTIPLSSVQNVYSYLGRSLYSDPYLLGSIDEFRIYDYALDDEAIAKSYSLGPEMTPPLPVILSATDGSTVVFENNLSGVTQDSYTIELESPPTAQVTVTAVASDPALLSLGGNSPGVPYDVVFSAGQTGPLTVTVESVNTDDAYAGPRPITINHSGVSSDPNYNGDGRIPLKVTYYDDDSAYFLIDEGDGVTVSETNPAVTDSFTVQLLSPPSSDVTFRLTPDANQIDTDFSSLTVNAETWYVKQTINVNAIDDSIVEHDPHNALLAIGTVSDDSSYNEMTGEIVPLITENDCGGWGYLPMDFNQDCRVNILDLEQFVSKWLSCTTPSDPDCEVALVSGIGNDCGDWGYLPMDFNQDCLVNESDLVDFASKWLSCTTPYESDSEKYIPSDSYNGRYLFTYFTSQDGGLRLAYSYDGLNWEALNDGNSLLDPAIGGGLMRDPCITYGPDGLFHLVWTTGWGDRGIGYASSSDLINWSEQQFIPVMAHEPNAQNCWAPEIFYNKAKQHYQIFWATTITGAFPETLPGGDNNHRMYYVTTKDFETYSSTKLFYEPGFNVIDATIFEENLKFYMFIKNETRFPVEKNIRLTTAYHADGPWTPVSDALTTSWVEGPSVMKVGNRYILYVDNYVSGLSYFAYESYDLETWTDISSQLNLPSGAAHGTIFKAPDEVIDNLIAY